MKLLPCPWLGLLNIAHSLYPGESGLLQVCLGSLTFIVQRKRNLASFEHVASDRMDDVQVELGVLKQPMPTAYININRLLVR